MCCELYVLYFKSFLSVHFNCLHVYAMYLLRIIWCQLINKTCVYNNSFVHLTWCLKFNCNVCPDDIFETVCVNPKYTNFKLVRFINAFALSMCQRWYLDLIRFSPYQNKLWTLHIIFLIFWTCCVEIHTFLYWFYHNICLTLTVISKMKSDFYLLLLYLGYLYGK